MLKAVSISLQPQTPNTKEEKGVPSKGFIRNGAIIEGINFKPNITRRRKKFRVIDKNPSLNPKAFGNVTILENMGNVFHPRTMNA